MRKLYEALYDSSERNAKYTSWQSIKLIEAILVKLSLSVDNMDIAALKNKNQKRKFNLINMKMY